MADEIPELIDRINSLELELLQQEHRPVRVFYNLWVYRDDPVRRPATFWAVFSWFFSPGVIAAAGVSVLGVLGVIIAYQANSIIKDQNALIRDQIVQMQEQNQLLVEQNRETQEEQRNNLYFQRLTRRTYLLTVLYGTDETSRVRREALYEFLKLDRELKESEVKRDPSNYLGPEKNEEILKNWGKLLILRPELRVDLSGVVLKNMNLEHIDLSNAILNDVDFSCTNLNFAILDESELKNTKFVGAELEGASLVRASAKGADFSESRLNGAYLNNSWLQDVTFDRAFMWKTNFADYRNERFAPKSANLTFVSDLHDNNDSGGAGKFAAWAIANGAVTGGDYETWKQNVAQFSEEKRITKCSSQ